MIQYNSLNLKLSNSRLTKLNSAVKNSTKLTSRLSSNMNDNPNDEVNLPHKLLVTDRQSVIFLYGFCK